MTDLTDPNAALSAVREMNRKVQPARVESTIGPTTNGAAEFEVGLTPNLLKAAGKGIVVVCGCGARRDLELLALIVAGKGSVDLLEAWERGKFRCSDCGGSECGLELVG